MSGPSGEAGLEQRILYVGVDDSNHAGFTKAEIVLATFSFFHEDSIVRQFPNRRDYASALRWLGPPEPEQPLRDYRFAILTHKDFRHGSQNVPVIAPYLVKAFIEDYQKAYQKEIHAVKLYFDGRLTPENRYLLRKEFSAMSPFVVNSFMKKQGIHCCPNVVYMADTLSNMLYSQDFKELAESSKFVPLPISP